MQKGQPMEHIRKAFNLVEKPIKQDHTNGHRNYDPILQQTQPKNKHSRLRLEI
jgi:hypothetical protein